ncbi:hypothetical protein [Mucilaginibacter sp. HD30]
MKNPFKKKNNTAIIATIAVASIAAGAVAYLFLTESGSNVRSGLKKKIKSIAKDAAVDAIAKHTRIPKKVAKAAAAHVAN